MAATQIEREPALAGSFYAADAAALARQVDACLSRRRVASGPAPKAIIAPHAGLVYSGPVAASAYAALHADAGVITRIVLLGPSHHFALDGFAVPEAEVWRTPLGTLPLDRAALDALALDPDVVASDRAHAPEHCLEVHLPFIQRLLGEVTLAPVLVGRVTPGRAAAVLRALWGGPETRVVISSDLSHFFPQEVAQQVDAETTATIEALDADAMLDADACGRYPVAGLLHEARRRGMAIETLDVRTSADTAGDPSRVVGYGSWLLRERTEAPS